MGIASMQEFLGARWSLSSRKVNKRFADDKALRCALRKTANRLQTHTASLDWPGRKQESWMKVYENVIYVTEIPYFKVQYGEDKSEDIRFHRALRRLLL